MLFNYPDEVVIEALITRPNGDAYQYRSHLSSSVQAM
jgi:hypothetical protein